MTRVRDMTRSHKLLCLKVLVMKGVLWGRTLRRVETCSATEMPMCIRSAVRKTTLFDVTRAYSECSGSHNSSPLLGPCMARPARVSEWGKQKEGYGKKL